MLIDDELRAFLLSGVTCLVASGNESGVPELSMALACWAADGDRLEVALNVAESSPLRAVLKRGGARIALVACRPYDLKTFQFKGSKIGLESPTESILERLCQALTRLSQSFERIGFKDPYAATLLRPDPDGVVLLRLQVDEVFEQTPGPKAGQAKVTR